MPKRETIEQAGVKLRERRRELLARLRLTEETWNELRERPIEYEERATNDYLSAPLAEIDEQLFRELEGIDRALLRIEEEGEYGFCVSCGRPISESRLRTLPWAEKCVECAARTEPETPEPETEAPVLPAELAGLDNAEVAERLFDVVRTARIVDTEELRITCRRGLVWLEGYLPSEKEHLVLRQYLTDTVGLATFEDHLLSDRRLWEDQRRTPGLAEPAPSLYDIVAEGEGEPTPDATEAQRSGLPMDASDEFIPEKQTGRT